MLPGAPQLLSPDRDRMLVTAFRSPATAPAFTDSIPGSTFLACYFASSPAGSTARSALLLHCPDRFAPVPAASLLLARCSFAGSARPAASPASTPLWDFYIPPDQSVLPDSPPVGPPSESARSPFAPRSRFLFLVFRLRIIVPGPLRFRRLAVPQTSWNLLHYGPEGLVSVNYFLGIWRSFPQYRCDLFSMVY